MRGISFVRCGEFLGLIDRIHTWAMNNVICLLESLLYDNLSVCVYKCILACRYKAWQYQQHLFNHSMMENILEFQLAMLGNQAMISSCPAGIFTSHGECASIIESVYLIAIKHFLPLEGGWKVTISMDCVQGLNINSSDMTDRSIVLHRTPCFMRGCPDSRVVLKEATRPQIFW